mmetsp:Transcript_13232/g.25990  ORF Transcript_13232/g.25990 Transcript_13232/m.25990 type:complete len:208 (-) Transcript_13232:20-643(-)
MPFVTSAFSSSLLCCFPSTGRLKSACSSTTDAPLLLRLLFLCGALPSKAAASSPGAGVAVAAVAFSLLSSTAGTSMGAAALQGISITAAEKVPPAVEILLALPVLSLSVCCCCCRRCCSEGSSPFGGDSSSTVPPDGISVAGDCTRAKYGSLGTSAAWPSSTFPTSSSAGKLFTTTMFSFSRLRGCPLPVLSLASLRPAPANTTTSS